MNIELSSRDDVAQLLESLTVPQHSGRHTHTGSRGARGKAQAQADMQQREVRSNRRCRCGVCYSCRENARWDRIFNEKFADPSYYSGLRAPRMLSPLGSL